MHRTSNSYFTKLFLMKFWFWVVFLGKKDKSCRPGFSSMGQNDESKLFLDGSNL